MNRLYWFAAAHSLPCLVIIKFGVLGCRLHFRPGGRYVARRAGRQISLLLFCFFLLNATGAGAQATGDGGRLIIKKYTTADGLVNNYINTLYFDRENFLWLLSDYGFARWNGHEYKSFPVGNGLLDNAIFSIRQATDGTVYFGVTGGIEAFAGKSSRAHVVVPLPGNIHADDLLPLSDTSFLLSMGLTGTGLYEAGPHHLTHIAGITDHVFRIEQGPDGLAYAMSYEYNCYLLRGAHVAGRLSIPPCGKGGADMYKDRSGDVWCMTGNACYRLAQGRLADSILLPADIPNPYSMCYTAGNGRLYIGGARNIYYYAPSEGWRTIGPDTAMEAFDLAEDPAGVVWAATRAGLISIRDADMLPTGTDNYYRRLNKPEPVVESFPGLARLSKLIPPGRRISRAYQSADGTYWLCTDDGLYYFPHGSGPAKRHVSPDTSGNVNDKFYYAMVPGQNGDLWTDGMNGTDQIHGYGESFRHYGPSDGLPKELYSFNSDRNGDIYAGNYGLFALEGDRFTEVLPQRLGHTRVYNSKILKSAAPGVWVSNQGHYIYHLLHEAGSYRITDSIAVSLYGEPVNPDIFVFDKADALWVTTAGHLLIYPKGADGRYDSTQRLTIPIPDGKFHHVFNGLGDTMYLKGSEWLRMDRAALLARYGKRSTPVSGPFITDVIVTGKALEGYKEGTKAVFTFNRFQNSFVFRFTAASPFYGEALRYRYRLKELERGWHLTTTGEVVYERLPEGHYTFQLTAADGQDRWTPPAEFSFIILPPWYRSWWAYILDVLLVLGIGYGIFTLRIKAVKRKEKTERLLLEQQLKALRAQINPHFLQNTFEFLSQTLDEQPVQRSQQVIAQLSSYLRNVLYRSDENVVTLEDELEFAEEYLAINRLLFHDAFSYQIDLGDEVDTFGLKVPSLLLQPVLENAIKHGAGRGGGLPAEIRVRVFADAAYTYCVVTNTASEEPHKQYPQGYQPKGLSITDERLKLLYPGIARMAVIAAKTLNGLYEVTIRIPL